MYSETGTRQQMRPALVPMDGPCEEHVALLLLWGSGNGVSVGELQVGRRNSERSEACGAGASCRRCRDTTQAILGSGHGPHVDKPDRKGAGTGSSFTGRNTGDPKEGRQGPWD